MTKEREQRFASLREVKCINCGSTEHILWHYIVPLEVGGKVVDTNRKPLYRVCKYAVDHNVPITEAKARFR